MHISSLRLYLFTLILIFFSAASGLTAQPAGPETGTSAPTTTSLIDKACQLIYQGKFETAGKLIEHAAFDQPQQKALRQLANIVEEYQTIAAARRTARQKAYDEQLQQLDKQQAAADVNGLDDVNDIANALATIAKASELADEKQKACLLSKPFVVRVINQAKKKAADCEAQGKWLDAYLNCYSWLKLIDQDNDAYAEHAEQLLTKANIVASFQDSPCETSKERYEAVKKRMFTRAIDTLDFSYVSPLDYRQMAKKAIERCKLLAEVMKVSYDEITKSENKVLTDKETQGFFPPPDDKKLAAWSAALDAVLDEVNYSPTGMTKDKFINVFDKILALNSTTIQLPKEVLIAQFAEAALAALDPYTVMIWPKQVQDFDKMMTNEFTGIGIVISKEKGLLTVASLLPDTPAYYSGLDAEDIIEKIDGIPTKDMSLTCAVKNITGPKGTKVTLSVRRPSEDTTRNITIVRDKIVVPTIRGWQRTEKGKWRYMIDPESRIAYVQLTSFSTETADDFENVLIQLEKQGLKGLILDLRANSGGLLTSAIEVADKFIEKGLIVSTRPKLGLWTYAAASPGKTHPNYPLVVLIDAGSASASEIVAGALHDKKYKRAILVGQRTHGKGSVQAITTYPGGGAQLKYTTAYYHLPSGQRVNSREAMKKQGSENWGIAPDIKLTLTDNELKLLADVRRENEVLVKADHDSGAQPLKKHTVGETLAADPQLAVAMLVIKTKLIQNEISAKKYQMANRKIADQLKAK